MVKALAGSALTLIAASTASAHPGHGSALDVEAAHSLTHYVTEPIHFSVLLGVIALCVSWGFSRLRHARDRAAAPRG